MNQRMMVTGLLGLCLAVGTAYGAASDDKPYVWPKPVVDWYATVKSPNYDKATAGDPHFDDKTLWPGMTGKELFVKQQWPVPKRVLVWAHPGESASNVKGSKGATHDPFAPASWRDAKGAPATEMVFDDETDIVFPSSETPYSVNLKWGELSPKGLKSQFRHMTIGRNCSVPLGGDGPGRCWTGNVWVKKGGSTYGNGKGEFAGERHSFVRTDNPDDKAKIAQYFYMTKASQDITLEYCGHVNYTDEWKLFVGTVVIGPDSFCRPGRGASPFVGKGATLVLLDGAYWGKWCNEWNHPVDLTVNEGGTLQGGLPDRPLTRDATVALSFRNWAGLDFSEWMPRKAGQNYGHPNDIRVSGIFRAGSTIRTVAAPGSAARLIITRHLVDGHGGTPDSDEGSRGVTGIGSFGRPRPTDQLAKEGFRKTFLSQPFKTLILLDKDVRIDTVRFDHFPVGGILYTDEATRKNWKNLEFGDQNLGKPETLFRLSPGVNKDGLLKVK